MPMTTHVTGLASSAAVKLHTEDMSGVSAPRASAKPPLSIRELYTQMLRKQLERGNNGLIKTKYLTLTIEARDSKTARARFSRIVMDALNHFKVMGALAKELGGKEWLEMLHGILHPDGERFAFEWSWLAPSGLSVQDFIAPSSFRFGEARKFTMADKFCAVSFLQISAPEMDDRMLTELLDTDSGLLVSLHIRSMDQNEAIKTVKRKITDIDSMKIDAQKKAVREGFDMDIIPTDLATYAGEAKNILRDLQSRNERMFLMTFLVVNFADSKQKLENDLLRAASVAQKYNCSLVRLDFQQEDGFVSALPLGVNRIKIQRGLTTSAVSVFVPFTTQEIFHGGEALYYGLNATSGNTLLSAMENAGKDDIPDEAERKGLGTPATRAAIIEKLVAAGFVERKGKSLIPTKAGINLVTVLPEPLTSPMLTAEWEQKLTEIAKGGADPDTFMDGIRTMVQEIVSTYSCISEDGKKLFAPEKEVIGTCLRCGQPVYEGKKNFACSDRSCGFVLWKNDRFWTSRKKELTKKMATDLLKKGRTNVKGMWSEKKQAAYDAAVILDDTGGKYINFKLEFPKRKEGVNGRK